MQDIYKDLMLLEDEQEEQDKDLVLDMIDSLTHFYVEEEDRRYVPGAGDALFHCSDSLQQLRQRRV